MKNVLYEFYRGNINPHETPETNTPEMKQMLGYISCHHEKLEKSMSDEQKQILEKYTECYYEYQTMHAYAMFEYGFKLGVTLMIEMLTDDEAENEL